MKMDKIISNKLDILNGKFTVEFISNGELYEKDFKLVNEDGSENKQNAAIYNAICEEMASSQTKKDDVITDRFIGGVFLTLGAVCISLALKTGLKLYDIGKTPDYEVIESYYEEHPEKDIEEIEEYTALIYSANTVLKAGTGAVFLGWGVGNIADSIKASKELKKKRKKNR